MEDKTALATLNPETPLLDQVQLPVDIRDYSTEQLKQLAACCGSKRFTVGLTSRVTEPD